MKKHSVLGVVAIAGIIGFGGVAQADLNDGLVAHYPFNSNANDASGNGNDGTINGATLFTDRNGNMGRAYSFDGNNDYIQLSNPNSLLDFSEDTDFTIAGFVKIEPGNIDTFIISSESAVCNDFRINLRIYNNQLQYYLSNHCMYNDTIEFNYDEGEWIHFAISKTGNYFSAYYNGSLVGEQDLHNASGSNANQSGLTLGRYLDENRLFFKGSIDELRIYNRALAESEIQELYNEDSGCTGSYDEGYEAGRQACINNPASCGITAGKGETCPTCDTAASYEIWSTVLTIPNVMVGDNSYSVELEGPYNIISATPTN